MTADDPGDPGTAEPDAAGELEASADAEGDGRTPVGDGLTDGTGVTDGDGLTDGDGRTGPGPTNTNPTSNAPATRRPANRPARMDRRDPMGREGTSTCVPGAGLGLRW